MGKSKKKKFRPANLAEEKIEARPIVRLEVYLRVAGSKPDQLAGFKRYAKSKELAPRTISEWKDELKKFMNKPTI